MFVIWGFSEKEEVLGYSYKPYRCDRCNNVSQYKIVCRKKYFTLFWIPLFSVNTEYYIACPICNYGFKVPKEEAMLQMQAPNQP